MVVVMVFCPRRPFRERQQPPRELEESEDFHQDSFSWEVLRLLLLLPLLPCIPIVLLRLLLA